MSPGSHRVTTVWIVTHVSRRYNWNLLKRIVWRREWSRRNRLRSRLLPNVLQRRNG